MQGLLALRSESSNTVEPVTETKQVDMLPEYADDIALQLR